MQVCVKTSLQPDAVTDRGGIVSVLGVEESDEVLCLQMARDQDEFNRWEASQKLATRVMVRRVQAMERGESAGLRNSSCVPRDTIDF